MAKRVTGELHTSRNKKEDSEEVQGESENHSLPERTPDHIVIHVAHNVTPEKRAKKGKQRTIYC
jgi:hypothetical protein